MLRKVMLFLALTYWTARLVFTYR